MLKRPLASTAEEERVLKNLVEDIRRRGEDCPCIEIDPADFPNWKGILSQIVAETGFDFSNKLLISKASGESWEDPCCQANASNASNAANAANDVQFVHLKKPISSPAEEERALKSLVEEIRRRGEDSPRFVINPADFPNWLHIMRKIILETGFDTNHKLMLGQPPCECCSNCTNSENETHQRPKRLDTHRRKAMNRKSVELVYAKSSIERVWGPYEEVHPAALGAASQGKYFTRAGYQPSREHPAAYAIHPRV